jgi:hypothetical protein
MDETLYCYHCRVRHPKAQMRLLNTKTGKRWRCIKSIEATKQGRAAREAFGREVTAINKAEAQNKAAAALNMNLMMAEGRS